MKAVIVGCGRVGAGIADELDRAGWQVVIIDLTSAEFDRLPLSFGGLARRGDGTDEDTLRQVGTEHADLFLALTEGDNRNVMAAQLAVEAFHVRRCIAKINDPVRAEAYAHLGITSLCRTNLMLGAVFEQIGHATVARPGIYEPAPVQPHPGVAGEAGEGVDAHAGEGVDAHADGATDGPGSGPDSLAPGGTPANGVDPAPRDPSLDATSPEA